MKRPNAVRKAAMAFAALLLAGCEPPRQQAAIIYPEPLPPLSAPVAAPPVPEPGPDLGEGLPNPANATCMAAVGERAGDLNVRVLENQTVAEGTEVTIGVGPQATRWRCVAGPGGELVEVGEVGAPLPDAG